MQTNTPLEPQIFPFQAQEAGSFTTEQHPATQAVCRLEKVSPRDLRDAKSVNQLLSTVYDALEAHRRLFMHAGILHGHVNPNTILMLETESGRVEGALIDYDMPLCNGAMRKLHKPDPVVPPSQSPRCRPYYWRES